MEPKNKLFIQFLAEETSTGGQPPWGQRLPEEKRAAWHRFVGHRQALGKCIRCQRKHAPDVQCCKTHKEENRIKCLAWARKNREYVRSKYNSRVAAGLCTASPDHGEAEKGHTRCKACRAKIVDARLRKNTRLLLKKLLGP